MKAIILAGGGGTRLREHTELIPKPMVEIGGRPILWHIMQLYSRAGINEFIICLGYKGDIIRRYFLNYHAMESDFTVKLGKSSSVEFHDSLSAQADWKVTLVDTGENSMTGSRVFRASKYLDSDDSFCLTYGDGLSDIDISKVITAHKKHSKLVTVTGVHPPSRFGEIAISNERVISFTEKPQMQSGVINGGFFVMKKEFLKYLNADSACVLEREPLELCAANGEVQVYNHEGFWQCMDTYRDWLLLEDLWKQENCPWRLEKSEE